ncbi:MAG: hypothetical protein II861_03990 [Methanomicrobium sp.]|nr:hypothetical protein [Methanomicrobium sp.]MBQ6127119.1 hypothetical protein [Candidatus Saccharibacteria bacterium]
MNIVDEQIREMTAAELLSKDILYSLIEEPDEERARLSALLIIRAAELGIQKQFEKVLKAFNDANEQLAKEYTRQSRAKNGGIELETDGSGKPLSTIENFVRIIEGDTAFDGIQFNLLTNAPEKVVNGEIMKWTNADDADYRHYCESNYHIHNLMKSDDALRIVFERRTYHPLKEMIESIEWDKNFRIERFLNKWTNCEDTSYTREVSRLIFAGGINRIYNAGCKFDYMPVLIGTHQGEGKSTLIRALAMRDEWFTEINEFDGPRSIEALEGAWICEVSELLALTRTKEQEAVKAFLSRQTDRYRTPYDKRPEDRPRQCIFIGTTNKETPLSDRTGNRRFLPVKVNQSGYEIFNRMDELKEDIRQCWAEAKYRYDNGLKMETYLPEHLMPVARAEQANATEDDYRVGQITQYLQGRKKTCIIDIWIHALDNPYAKPSKPERNEIALILQGIDGWERDKSPTRFDPYGYQVTWSYRGKDKSSF